MRDPFVTAAAYRGVMPRQRAHEGPSLTIYPRKALSGWIWAILGAVPIVAGLAMVLVG